jgi:hypothetical protein
MVQRISENMKLRSRSIASGLLALLPSWVLACTINTGAQPEDSTLQRSVGRTTAAITVSCPTPTPYAVSIGDGARAGGRAIGAPGDDANRAASRNEDNAGAGMIAGNAGPVGLSLDLSALLPARPDDAVGDPQPVTVVVTF